MLNRPIFQFQYGAIKKETIISLTSLKLNLNK